MAPATRREALNITIDTSLSSKRVIRELNHLIDWRGKPEKIRVDNGPCDGRRSSLLKPGKNASSRAGCVHKSVCVLRPAFEVGKLTGIVQACLHVDFGFVRLIGTTRAAAIGPVTSAVHALLPMHLITV